MSKDPAILFYTGDFLNGCTDLTFDERGQYITLLCLQHQKGHLSEKTIRLTVGSVSVDVLKKFIKDEEGNYFNERMDEEIKKRQHFLDTRYFNGKQGGRPSKPNRKPNRNPNNEPTENLPINENEDYSSLLKKVLTKNLIQLPEGFEELILEWLQYKSEKRQSYKETGLKTLIKTFLRDSNSDTKTGREMLDYSMSKNYSGLFKERVNGNPKEDSVNSPYIVTNLAHGKK